MGKRKQLQQTLIRQTQAEAPHANSKVSSAPLAMSFSMATSFMLVPDVLGLIALQMDHPTDFASFSLTCSAWYQATVDNAHLLESKMYQMNKLDFKHKYPELYNVIDTLSYCEECVVVDVRRKYGSKLWQITNSQGYIISETMEGYWLGYFPSHSILSDCPSISVYSPELRNSATVGQVCGSDIEVFSCYDQVTLRYPPVKEHDFENEAICHLEERFRTWTSVQDFGMFFCEILRSVPVDTPFYRYGLETPSDELLGRLLQTWLECLGADYRIIY